MENSSGSWGWEFVNREGSALQRTGASPRRSSPKTYGAMPKEGVPLSVVVEGITAADTQTGQKAPVCHLCHELSKKVGHLLSNSELVKLP